MSWHVTGRGFTLHVGACPDHPACGTDPDHDTPELSGLWNPDNVLKCEMKDMAQFSPCFVRVRANFVRCFRVISQAG